MGDMARFLPLRDVYSASEDEDDQDETTVLTDDVDGPGRAFEKYYTRFIEKYGSGRRAKAKRKRDAEQSEKDKVVKPPIDEHEYDFYNAKRGLAIIINNDKFQPDSGMGDRKGSKNDAQGLLRMFKQLGFDVKVHNNLTTKQMVSTLKEAASNKSYDHDDADCFACAILTHGGEEIFQPRDNDSDSDSKVRHDVVFGVDGTLIPTRFLLSIFNDECCPELAGKPRLFFLQACRGGKLDDGLGLTVLRRKTNTHQEEEGGGDEGDAKIYLAESEEEYESAEEEVTPGSKQPKASDTQPQKEQRTKREEMESSSGNSNTIAQDDASITTKQVKGTDVDRDNPGTQGQTSEKKLVSEEPGVVYSRMEMERLMTISPSPIYKDFLLVYAAPPGYFAWRRDSGGWLIQTLVSVLTTADVTSVPLTKLLTTVSRRVSTEYQSASRKVYMNRKKLMPCVMSMLTKDVFFRSKAF